MLLVIRIMTFIFKIAHNKKTNANNNKWNKKVKCATQLQVNRMKVCKM